MKRSNKRTYSRNGKETEIKYTTGDTDIQQCGTVRNSCPAGMCLKTKKSITPGTNITIKKGEQSAEEIYQAIVKWCHANTRKEESDYNIGVQYQLKTYSVVDGKTVMGGIPYCDLCAKPVNSGQIHEIMDAIYLCTSCLSYLNALDHTTRQSIEQFLMGNIL